MLSFTRYLLYLTNALSEVCSRGVLLAPDSALTPPQSMLKSVGHSAWWCQRLRYIEVVIILLGDASLLLDDSSFSIP
jgi:hypothetical protein